MSLPPNTNIDGIEGSNADLAREDLVVQEVLRHIPKRSKKNAEHLLEAISRS